MASGVLAMIGALIILLAGIGVIRLPDLYSRMHAATKVPTLGLAFIALATALQVSPSKVLLALILMLITGPAAAHMVGRSAYRAQGIDHLFQGDDELESRYGPDDSEDDH